MGASSLVAPSPLASCSPSGFDKRNSLAEAIGDVTRCAAILLALWFAVLGTGLLTFGHNAAHAHEDARLAAGLALAGNHHPGGDQPPPPRHDEANCAVHAQLAQPIAVVGGAPLLVCLGLFVALLTQLAPQCTPRRAPVRIDCRGPPAC